MSGAPFVLVEGKPMYEQITHNICVTVHPVYLDDQSNPDENRFFWAYHVTIENRGDTAVQIIGRHWRISDSKGCTIQVSGDGVVGERPVLEPGEIYEYTSGTPLAAPNGIMLGQYSMLSNDGTQFPVDIPAFSLDSPHHHPVVH